MSVYTKLAEFQSKIKVPKDQTNNFSKNKYKFRSAEDIMQAAKPICDELKVMIFNTEDLVLIGDRYYVKSTARFVDLESGEDVATTAYAREEESKTGFDVAQVTGSTTSYARKYALSGLLQLDDGQDPDTQDNSQMGNHRPRETAEVKYICEDCKEEIKPVKRKDGSIMSVREIKANSQKAVGRTLCAKCATKAIKAQQEE